MDADIPYWKTLSLFEPQRASFAEIVAGVVSAFGAVVVLPIVVVLTSLVFDAIFGNASADDGALPPIEVVETRFVRLGTPEPRALPDLEAPSTDEPPAPATEPEPSPTPAPVVAQPKPSKKAKPRKRESAEDMLAQLGQSADKISGLSRGAQRQGHAEGIAEGTKLDGDASDLYKGKLYAYFRRGWQVPGSIPDADLKKLTCLVEFTITDDARVGPFEIVRPSGNDFFDASVRQRMAQAEGSGLPKPPKEVADQFIGETISLLFYGRHAR